MKTQTVRLSFRTNREHNFRQIWNLSKDGNQNWPEVEILTKHIFCAQHLWLLKISVASVFPQCVHPRINQRMGATAVTHLPATASHRKLSSSTSVMRAMPWKETTSFSPARTASGMVPCRSAADSHKVFVLIFCVCEHMWPYSGNVESESVNHILTSFLSSYVPQTRSQAPRWVYQLCLLLHPQLVLWLSSCF